MKRFLFGGKSACAVNCAQALFHFSLRQEMLPVQLFQLIGGVVRAEPAIDEAAREAPIPAVFVDHAVHDAIDFKLHVYPPKKTKYLQFRPGAQHPGGCDYFAFSRRTVLVVPRADAS